MWLEMVLSSTNKYLGSCIYVLLSSIIPISNLIAALRELLTSPEIYDRHSRFNNDNIP